MSRKTALFCLIAVAAAALFSRFGFWQIARLQERRARNVVVAAQQRGAAQPFAELPRDTARARFRSASVAGRFDYEHELVLTSRMRDGAPGVELFTPVRVPGSDTAVLVNRGWVYAPDGFSVDRPRWREGDSARVTGFVDLYAPDADRASSADPRIVRRVSRREIAGKIPYPVAPYYLVALGDTADKVHPARRGVPPLDDGPHRGYAIQWFAFAAIALGGAGAVLWRERKGGGHHDGGPGARSD